MHYKLLIYQNTQIDFALGYLQMNGFAVDFANRNNILEKIEARSYDACILDAYSPDDRFSLVKKARALSNNVAILFLTKDHAYDDAVDCFNAGADDYMHIPYDARELVCRLNAVLRRSGKSSFEAEHNIGKYIFDPKAKTLCLGNKSKALTRYESKLLSMLSEYRNTILPRSVALKAIWLDDNVFNGRSMDVYISRLRKYLADDSSVSIISVRSQGFILAIE